MRSDKNTRGLHRMPPGYLYAFAVALIGFAFVGIGLGAILNGGRGADPMDTMSGLGLAAFIAMYVPAFGVRMVFWRGAPPRVREGVRTALILLFCAEIAVALWTLILLGTVPNRHAQGWSGGDVIAPVFAILGAFCQIGTVWWLVRYRRETGGTG